jgi:hypothetical protein
MRRFYPSLYRDPAGKKYCLPKSFDYGNVRKIIDLVPELQQPHSHKKPDVYSQADNDFVHLFCFGKT